MRWQGFVTYSIPLKSLGSARVSVFKRVEALGNSAEGRGCGSICGGTSSVFGIFDWKPRLLKNQCLGVSGMTPWPEKAWQQ